MMAATFLYASIIETPILVVGGTHENRFNSTIFCLPYYLPLNLWKTNILNSFGIYILKIILLFCNILISQPQLYINLKCNIICTQ